MKRPMGLSLGLNGCILKHYRVCMHAVALHGALRTPDMCTNRSMAARQASRLFCHPLRANGLEALCAPSRHALL